MIDIETKKIGETTYKVRQMDAIRGLRAQTKLIKLLGPAVGKTLIAGEKSKSSMLDKAVGHLVDNFDDDEVSNFIIGLFEKGVFYTDKEGEDSVVVFKEHFTGKPSEMWKVAFFVLKVNFGELLGKFKGGSPLLNKIVSDYQKEN